MKSNYLLGIVLSLSLTSTSSFAYEKSCGMAQVHGGIAVILGVPLVGATAGLMALAESVYDVFDYNLSDYTEEQKKNYDWYSATAKRADEANPETLFNNEVRNHCAADQTEKPKIEEKFEQPTANSTAASAAKAN